MSAKAERNAEIVRRREGGETLTGIGASLGLSKQRVEQIIRPARHHARNRVWDAKRRGAITPPSACDRCGAEGRIEAHHTDYTRPLAVVWLCVPCHKAVDARPRHTLTLVAA